MPRKSQKWLEPQGVAGTGAKPPASCESRPAEMSRPGSCGGGDRVKACLHPKGAGWRHWACPLVSNELPPPWYLPGVRYGCQQYQASSHQCAACVGLPCLASRWLGSRPEAPPILPRQTLGNPEEPLNSSQGSRGSRAAGWWLPCQGPAHPDGRQA